ncbi:transcription elongation regulator 1 [Phlebotomus argentipes]|uniref:transcription elongation regulator 1 n=1 Tax=Phlebotomus argentipes TaxID=94469 RepID=UPI002892EEB3|nr:transcription elongation regulator 1 [Phlebotomus argentipes]
MEVETPKDVMKMETDEQVEQNNEQVEEEEFNRFQGGGRGGFRGRPWGPPPRFGGRGYGPPGGGMMRGRGGGQPPFYHRGRGVGPPPGRFQGPNYDPNWQPMGQPPYMNGPPGMNPHMPYGGGPPGMQAPPIVQELWVETKTEEGKSYYYHAVSRETTWTRPEGPHIKIMTHTEVEALNAKNPQQSQQQNNTQAPGSQPAEVKSAEVAPKTDTPVEAASVPPESIQTEMNPTQTEAKAEPPISQAPPPVVSQAPPTQATPQIQPLMQTQFMNTPPPQYNQQAQFAMPPPGFHGFPPTQWGVPPLMPWGMHQDGDKKGGDVDPAILAKAAEWTEHKAPDGRPYYYHAAKAESVWEKPQALRDLEAARMATQHIHAPLMPPAQHQVPPPSVQGSVVFDPLGFVVKPQEAAVKKDEESAEAKAEKKKKADAERKKKEEEEKAKVAKQQDKTRPISSTPISGTPWCVVWTGDGRVFFYNPSTRTSVWERPEDLLERADVDKAVSTPPEQLANVAAVAKPEEAKVAESPKKRSESETSEDSDETPTKKAKLEDDLSAAGKSVEKKGLDIGKEAAMEAEVRASRERALVPLETRVKSFKEMLKEKDVSAFSTWEKELHKIVFDPRYLLLTSRERKQVFEKYVKERAEEERREKRNKMRQKRDDFRSLMESANLHGKSSFSDFVQRFSKDDRFKAIEKVREREGLFNEFIVDLRKREKEDKIHKKEQVRKDFIEMLKNHPDIDRHCRWVDVKKKTEGDSRYRAVESGVLREDYFHEYCRMMKEEKKRAKEKDKDREKEKEKKEKKGKRDRSKDREKEREKRRRDSYKESSGDKGRESSVDQEEGEHPPTSDDETDKQQKDRERQIRAEASIKEREKEVQRTLATHLRDRDKEREHHKRDEAIRHFNALLADLVRNADLTWKEVKKQLRKDHRWELVEQLEREDRERIFNDHISNLTKKKRDKFREMLDELGQLELTSSWKEIKKTIKEDPRYLKYNSSERCEREFREYIKDKTVEAKSAFRELLQECKLITHKSFDTLKENPNHLKEIEDILKNDKRYLVLEHIAHERTQMILHYLEDLFKRGPPPPPTASESTRRK